MARNKIVVIEDDRDIHELITYNLKNEGYQVISAYDGEQGLFVAQKERPDLVVLDLMLPKMEGLEICRVLKNSTDTKAISIVMLTAKGDESDVIVGLQMGADDYLTKPFSVKVLLARIKAVIRRGLLSGETQVTTGVRDLS
ncbi:MAG: response regulator, partial [Candidatus Omnitrophica bacterium]|nr:response regulator [Candidatus Omnitrophota bacterium]